MSTTRHHSMIPVAAGAGAPTRRRGRLRSVIHASMVAGLVCTLGLASASVAAAVTASAASASACGAPVQGMVRVTVVVDEGIGEASIACVVVPRGTKGSQLLVARAAQLGTSVPTHAGSGLLCTIDSFPSSGCSETSGGSYWANFSGTGGDWSYTEYNPFLRRVCDGDVEGWRYVVHGTGAAGDAAPRVAAGAVTIVDARGCDDSAEVPQVGAAPDAVAPSSGAMSSADPAAPADATSEPGVGLAEDVDAADAAGSSAVDGSAIDRAGTAQEVAASVGAVPAARSASTSWIGLLAVVLVIAGLGLAALVRSRRTA